MEPKIIILKYSPRISLGIFFVMGPQEEAAQVSWVTKQS